MRNVLMTGLVLFGVSAFADETKTTEVKTEVKTGKKKASTTVETKTTTDPDGLLNATDDKTKTTQNVKRNDDGSVEVKTERVVEHDAPGMKNDSKTKTNKTVVRDANGNIVKEEVKADGK